MIKKSRMRTLLLVAFIVIGSLPFVSMLIFSIFARWPIDSLYPQNFTLDGFLCFFKRDFDMAVNTICFSLGVSFYTLLLCIPAARGLLSMRRSVRKWIEPLFYFPMLLPVVSVSIGSHKLFLSLSMTGTAAVVLMHIYLVIPYVFQIVYSSHTVLGISTETAAKNLGIGKWRIFFQIHLPIYLSDYLSAYAMGFIISYSQYFVNFYLGSADNINFSMIMTPLITGSNRNIASVYTLMYLLFGSVVLFICSIIPHMLHRKKEGYHGKHRNS